VPQLLQPIETWSHTSACADHTVVVPDGCRDLILHALPHQPPTWFVTDLADSTYAVPGMVGERYWGFRMRPGTQVDAQRLLALLQKQPLNDAQDALPLLHDCTALDMRVADALHSLACHHQVAQAARQLGVSERTLQRLVQAATGRPPAYWKCLARVRRAAQALPKASSLAECAVDHGYTDQAHMTREFGRWLGRSPAGVLTSAPWMAAVSASGYC
jgi:AraC-like DNA-binding protein